MKIFSPYPGCHEVRIVLSDFSKVSTRKGYGDTIYLGITGSISHLLRLDPFNAGSIFLNVKLVALKKGNYEPIWAFKITEWRKCIDYFGLSIETDPSKVSKKKIYIFNIIYVPRPSFVKIHISRHHLDKELNL